MSDDRLDLDRERELDKLTAAANLQRMRGQWVEAEDTLSRALEMAPGDAKLQEMRADILREIGKLEAALEGYKTAMALAPGKDSLETKHAKLTLEIGERDRMRSLAEDMIVNPHKYTRRARNPVTALICAAVVPGLGQLYNGELVKGLVIFSAFLVFFVALGLLQQYPRGITSLTEFLNVTNPFVLVMGILAGVAYIYGVIDAPLAAQKATKSGAAKNPAEPE